MNYVFVRIYISTDLGVVYIMNHVFVCVYISNVVPHVNEHLKQLRGKQPEISNINKTWTLVYKIALLGNSVTLKGGTFSEKLILSQITNFPAKSWFLKVFVRSISLNLLKSCRFRSIEKRKRRARSALFCSISSNSRSSSHSLSSSSSRCSRSGRISWPRMNTPLAWTMFWAFVSFRESWVSAAQHAIKWREFS